LWMADRLGGKKKRSIGAKEKGRNAVEKRNEKLDSLTRETKKSRL